MVRKGLAGIFCFGLGGTFLMFVLHFILKDVYVKDIWDWISFFGWMSLFSFVGFFFFGLGIWLIIRDIKAETWAKFCLPICFHH